ncbi:E3 SUMO-protein ligase MMS21 [Linum grandiflorum]
MASASSSPGQDPVSGRIKRLASIITNDNQSLVTVKELESLAAEIAEYCDDCIRLTSAINVVGDEYRPTSESTDFKKLLDEEFKKLKDMPSRNDRLMRQFREAVWHVHHAGQPMPGEEQEDIVMTSTQSNLLNEKCPLTGKMITELVEPVRSVDCKHIYEKEAVMRYIPNIGQKKCCVAGCPKFLQARKLVCDPFLLSDIDELRSRNQNDGLDDLVEDFTALDDD